MHHHIEKRSTEELLQLGQLQSAGKDEGVAMIESKQGRHEGGMVRWMRVQHRDARQTVQVDALAPKGLGEWRSMEVARASCTLVIVMRATGGRRAEAVR